MVRSPIIFTSLYGALEVKSNSQQECLTSNPDHIHKRACLPAGAWSLVFQRGLGIQQPSSHGRSIRCVAGDTELAVVVGNTPSPRASVATELPPAGGVSQFQHSSNNDAERDDGQGCGADGWSIVPELLVPAARWRE